MRLCDCDKQQLSTTAAPQHTAKHHAVCVCVFCVWILFVPVCFVICLSFFLFEFFLLLFMSSLKTGSFDPLIIQILHEESKYP